MTLASLVLLAINVSMGLIVLALGLRASFADALYLLRRPELLLRSVLAMNVIMAIFAGIVAVLFNLHPAVKLTLAALALSPVPPILPAKQEKAGGSAVYVVALLMTMAALAIVVVPVGVELFTMVFGGDVTVPLGKITSVVLISIIAPLVIGLVIRYLAPALAQRAVRPISIIGTILLIAALVPALAKLWPSLMAMVGNGTLAALALFTLVGLAVGHLLGGPQPAERTVLALATGTRHPGVALAIAAAAAPNESGIIAVVLWHLVVGAIVSTPYVSWRRHGGAALAVLGPSAKSGPRR